MKVKDIPFPKVRALAKFNAKVCIEEKPIDVIFVWGQTLEGYEFWSNIFHGRWGLAAVSYPELFDEDDRLAEVSLKGTPPPKGPQINPPEMEDRIREIAKEEFKKLLVEHNLVVDNSDKSKVNYKNPIHLPSMSYSPMEDSGNWPPAPASFIPTKIEGMKVPGKMETKKFLEEELDTPQELSFSSDYIQKLSTQRIAESQAYSEAMTLIRSEEFQIRCALEKLLDWMGEFDVDIRCNGWCFETLSGIRDNTLDNTSLNKEQLIEFLLKEIL